MPKMPDPVKGKKAAVKKKTAKVVQSQFADPLDKSSTKSAMQARGRASKYGKPVGPTIGGSTAGSGMNKRQEALTTVKSSRGNTYVVTEDKQQRKFRPDKIKTQVSPSAKTMNKLSSGPKGSYPPKKKK